MERFVYYELVAKLHCISFTQQVEHFLNGMRRCVSAVNIHVKLQFKQAYMPALKTEHPCMLQLRLAFACKVTLLSIPEEGLCACTHLTKEMDVQTLQEASWQHSSMHGYDDSTCVIV